MSTKHIRYRAELIRPFCERVRVTILEQTHSDSVFGNRTAEGSWMSSYFSHNGFTLYSYMFAGFSEGRLDRVDLRGFLDDAHVTIEMPREVYRRFKETVIEYNRYFGNPVRYYSVPKRYVTSSPPKDRGEKKESWKLRRGSGFQYTDTRRAGG